MPRLTLLKQRDSGFRATPGTIGYLIEESLAWTPGKPLPALVAGVAARDLPGEANALVGVMSGLAGLLTDDLRELDFAAMTFQYRRLVEVATRTEELRQAGAFDAPGLSDRLDDTIFRCRLDPFAALVEEWKIRLREAKQAQFLGHFLAAHPGVQHKAGVPLGGTFVVVYHQPPTPALQVAGAPEEEPVRLALNVGGQPIAGSDPRR